MEFSVGDLVRLANGRTGRIARIDEHGRFDVNLDEDAVQAAERGHAPVRSPDQPKAQDIAVSVPAAELAKLPQA